MIQADDLIFYLDEIQNITGWEKFIRRLLDKEKMTIFITGSSAKLLSKEIATALRGRCLEKEVFPLGLSEYLYVQGVSDLKHLTRKEKAVIGHHVQRYMQQGGFPETLQLPDSLRRKTIQSYVNAAVFRDVIERYDLKSPHLVKIFLIHCLQNIAAPLSVTKVYQALKSRGETLSRSSLYTYLDCFESAYLIYSVPIFDLSARKRQVNPRKIYCVDPGVIYAYSLNSAMEQGACLENSVYIQLRKLEYENIYYYKIQTGKEVDFVAQQTNGQISLFHVCVNLDDTKTKKREINALVEAAKELQLDRAYIITANTEANWVIETITIHVVPYWQWVVN